MDAVKTKEWKMIIWLKDLHDEKAYAVFLIAHLPLYFAAIFTLVQPYEPARAILFFIIDIFLVFHAIIHFGFRKHHHNRFKPKFP
jgi:hypothetical protein